MCPMNPQYQKSVLTAYTSTSQDVAVNAPVVYDNIDVSTGCAINYTAGTPSINIGRQGLYLITANSTVTVPSTTSSAAATTDSATTSNIQVSLQNNGVTLPGSIASIDPVTAGDATPVSLTSVIAVRPSSCVIDNTARLQIVNTGVAATYDNVHITVIKIA